MKHHVLRRTTVFLAAFAFLASAHAPGRAQAIVYDPSNYVQNALQAVRALQQINNQITSLQNQAQMLLNQARNLTSLPYSSQQALDQSLARTQQLLGQAQRINYDHQPDRPGIPTALSADLQRRDIRTSVGRRCAGALAGLTCWSSGLAASSGWRGRESGHDALRN